MLRDSKDLGIKVASFFAFSTENWNRPKDEIDHLFEYLEEFFRRHINELKENGTRIVVSGDISRLPHSTREVVEKAIEETSSNDVFLVNICLNYGGRDEIVRAASKIASDVMKSGISIDEITEESFKKYLWHPEVPDIDLLIRTSGEQRISNFMLYQLAYAELVFTDVKWPDFDKEELVRCLEKYRKRERRYGGLAQCTEAK